MKVLLVNGSPKPAGCTYTALMEIAATLGKHAIETELFQIGQGMVYGCTGCGWCSGGEKRRCVYDDDVCNRLTEKAAQSDGFVFGSPVYVSGINGALCAIMDRAFASASPVFAEKPACGIVSCRRGGASTAFDRFNKYFTINRMPVVSSQYWNAVHGRTPDEVRQDLEGLQIMRTLGENMAWLLKMIDATRDTVPRPVGEAFIGTDFVDKHQ